METPTFIIDLAELSVGQRSAVQAIAARTLRSTGVLLSEEETRTPYEVLADAPNTPGADEAKVQMMYIIAGLSIDQA